MIDPKINPKMPRPWPEDPPPGNPPSPRREASDRFDESTAMTVGGPVASHSNDSELPSLLNPSIAEERTPMNADALHLAIQADLDRGIPAEEIRPKHLAHPFTEWVKAYLGCTRRIPIVTPWDEGTDFEATMIIGTLRRLAIHEGNSPREAFFLVYELMHGRPHPEAKRRS